MLRFQLQRHELFECELKLQGVQYKTLKPRLILTTQEGRELYFEGKMESSKCIIPVFLREEKPERGTAILELIVDDKEFIQPWNSPYESYTYNLVVTEQKKSAPIKKVPEKKILTKEEIHRILEFLEKKNGRKK